MTKVMPKSTTNPKIQSTSTTNTAIRIPSDTYKKISTQADQENKTVSSIINEVLRKYVTWDQFVSDIGFVFLQKLFSSQIFWPCFSFSGRSFLLLLLPWSFICWLQGICLLRMLNIRRQ